MVATMTQTTEQILDARPVAARTVAATSVYGEGDLAVTALDAVDIELRAGELTAIMGPSGSGKSTLMHAMAGLDQLTSGSAFVGETDLSTLKERELTALRRDHIGFVFQAFNLVPMLTAEENIRLPLTLARSAGDGAWIDHVIDAVGLTERRKHRPSEMSGGQQQRVAVARAMASRPDVIFADEPTGNLDRRSATDVLGLLQSAVHDEGQTIAMVTHDPNAATFADRVVVLADGQIVAETTAPTVDTVLDMIRRLEA